MTDERKLNIGCANHKKEGYFNLDINPKFKPDIVHDANKKFPFKDNYFTEIVSFGTFDYLNDMYELIKEMYRILKPDGKLVFDVNHFKGRGSRSLRRSLRTYRIGDFYDFTGIQREYMNYDIRFSKVTCRIVLYKRFQFWNHIIERLINISKRIQDIYETTGLSGLFPPSNIIVVMRK